ncbi:MAG TPA: type II CAAX endopeptidase family protein, partial [Verrucomicrobium sp.]|nr:type II CAAX endopeptidase family protein [Verrucomicrobium sp.]
RAPAFLTQTLPGLRTEILDLYQAAEKNGLRTVSFYSEFAIICQSLSQDARDSQPLLAADAMLRGVPDDLLSHHYLVLAKKALGRQPLSESEREMVVQFCELNPGDWWPAALAKQYQLPNPNGPNLSAAQADAAITAYLHEAFLLVGLAFVGLAGIPLTWRQHSLANAKVPASSARLFRLWRPAEVLGLYGFCSWITLALNALLAWVLVPVISPPIYSALGATVGLWLIYGFCWLFSLALFCLEMVLFLRTFGIAPAYLTRTMGFRWNDLWQDFLRWGPAGLAIIPFLSFGLSVIMEEVGIPLDVLDGLSRSFISFGAWSLPVSILVGVVLAPLVEEIVYRGFIFRSLQQRWGTGTGIAISSAIFSISHFYSLIGGLQVFGMGLLLGWVYHRTGRLATTIVIHALHNLAWVLQAHLAGA